MQLTPVKAKRVSDSDAKSLIKEYKNAPYKEPMDAVILSVLEYQLKRKNPIINVIDAINKGGYVKAGCYPNIALAPLGSEELYCDVHGEGSFVLYTDFDGDGFPAEDSWRFYVDLSEMEDPSDRWSTAIASLPPIPPRVRPKNPKGHFVLWEAEWQTIPQVGDPALLKHVYGPFFQVVDAWDLTSLEKRVLSSLIIDDD